MKATDRSAAVAKLTDAISEVQRALGIERTRKLLHLLADGLGAPNGNDPSARTPLRKPLRSR